MATGKEWTEVSGPYPAVVVDSTLVANMAERLPAQSQEMVQKHLGISATTWLKIKKGQPIRKFTEQMLLHRLTAAGLPQA